MCCGHALTIPQTAPEHSFNPNDLNTTDHWLGAAYNAMHLDPTSDPRLGQKRVAEHMTRHGPPRTPRITKSPQHF